MIIVLDDGTVMTKSIEFQLKTHLPHLTLVVCNDAEMAQSFATLPALAPALIRRNIRLDAKRPQHWRPDFLEGQHFENAYIHNSGFFMAKVVAGISDKVTLRESGLNNYIQRPVTGLKRLARLIAGYPIGSQVLGEETWVDEIAVSRPLDLPAQVRSKGLQLDLSAQLLSLTPAQKLTMLECLKPDFPSLPAETRNVLLITQPLDLVGMCDTGEKLEIYRDITDQLRQAGYNIFLKNHPRDTDFELPDTTQLKSATPIELWALTTDRRFDLSVALCSAALSHRAGLFCTKSVQIVDPAEFYPANFQGWKTDISRRLQAVLSQ